MWIVLSVLLETGYMTQTMKKALVLNRALSDMICAPSAGEGKAAKFESVFTAVRYICSTAQLKKG